MAQGVNERPSYPVTEKGPEFGTRPELHNEAGAGTGTGAELVSNLISRFLSWKIPHLQLCLGCGHPSRP